MVMKKRKTAKVEALVLEEEELHKLMACLSVGGGPPGVTDLAQTLKTCLELKDPVQQIQLVKKVGSQLETVSEEDPDGLLDSCLQTLSLVYVSLQAKNPLRRTIASALSVAPSWLQDRVVSSLSACLSSSLSRLSSWEQRGHVVDTITSCLDGFSLGERCVDRLLPEVLQFLHEGLRENLQHNRTLCGRHVAQAQLMHCCLAAVKTSMLVIQRSQETISCTLTPTLTSDLSLNPTLSPTQLEETLSNLLDCYTHILTDEEFVQSVQSTAGMAVVLLIRSVIGRGDAVAAVVCSLLRGSTRGLSRAPRWLRLRLGEGGLCSGPRPPGVSLYLSHGALAMLTWRAELPGPQWEELLLLVPRTLLDLDVSVKESSTAMVVSRVLTLWSSAALDVLQGLGGAPCPPPLQQALVGGSDLQDQLLDHIYSHWEHPLDGVRHQTRSLFRNLLLLHQQVKGAADPRADPYVTSLTQRLLGLEWHMRGKFGSLGCLVELYGASHLLALDPALPPALLGLMGDQTLAPYASDLLERLFLSHKAQLEGAGGHGLDHGGAEVWHQVWVAPLLRVLCRSRPDQTTYILDYFLPKLLRCSPQSLETMIQGLQETQTHTGPCGSRGPLGALMTCLRAARAQGVAPTSQDGLWGGLVPLSLLRTALVHKHHQVRMDALGLVCESHRSTEAVTSQEVELIRHFLPANLNSQSAGVRQQTVSLIKKLLCRLKDNTMLLQKKQNQDRDGDQHTLQQYKEFLRWMCVSLLDVLLPGSSFSKCLLALNLLCVLGDIFTFSTSDCDVFSLGDSVSSEHAQNVLYCIASNFLEVKQLASTLLRQLPPSAVGLQEEDRLVLVLQVSLDLSTSTRPFDSVTAAHLLGLLLQQPGLDRALLLCAQRQGLKVQPQDSESPPAESQTQQQGLNLQPQDSESQTQQQGINLRPQDSESPPAGSSILELNALAVIQLLLRLLQEEVQRAESSLLTAAASCPLYGRVHCITAVLQQLNTQTLTQTRTWRSLVSDLMAVVYRISDVVSPVVQSSSPEGLIPMDTDSEGCPGLQRILQEIQPRDTNHFFTSTRELDTHQHTPSHTTGEWYRVTAQMVLVCCWRSMKEVAMMLGQLCQSLPLHTQDTQLHTRDAQLHTQDAQLHTQDTTLHNNAQPGLITEQQVEGVGRYFRLQLLQSRHRGAFELAYVGFIRLTDMLCRCGSVVLQRLPSLWLSEVLQEVKSSDSSSKLCATRRSAGIPFYIQALLSSEPKSSSCSLLKSTMKELISLAKPEGGGAGGDTVPQVHALNILRSLFRDTRLGENIVPFVSDGLQAAVLGFTSPVWAVRNSSTLLFSTLITRIFGVKKGKDEHSKKNRMTGREFFTRFPSLYPFLLSQLEEAAATVDSNSGEVKLHPSLFLLLLVLSRLYPSPMDGSSSPLGLETFTPLIIRCGRCAVFRTRVMSARALVPFVLVTRVPSVVQDLIQDLPPGPGPGPGVQQNQVHGTLLQILFLLNSYQADSHRPLPAQTRTRISLDLHQRLWLASRTNSCVVTRGSFLDVLLCLCEPNSLLDDSEVSGLRQETLDLLLDSDLVSSRSWSPPGPGETQYLLSLTRLALSACVKDPGLWGVPESGSRSRSWILKRLLQSPVYEVRDLVLDQVLKTLDQDGGQNRTWLDPETLKTLMSRILKETHTQCLSKVLTLLYVLSSSCELQWRIGDQDQDQVLDQDQDQVLDRDQVLQHLLGLAQSSTHSVDLHCAALNLLSQILVQLLDSDPQAAAAFWAPWSQLVCSCCHDDQPLELKLTAANVLVRCTETVLTSPRLPLGLALTVSLWRSLFTLLQDEDEDVRDAASDFISNVRGDPGVSETGVCETGVCVCPPVALDSGLSVLCGLLGSWGRVPEGVLALTEWLMGNEEEEGDSGPAEEDFLFERGDLNLWAEPVHWLRLLHQHLDSLVQTLDQDPSPDQVQQLKTRAQVQVLEAQRDLDSLVQTLDQVSGPDQVQQLKTRAQVQVLEAQRDLDSLPVLPQFSATLDHARLVLRVQRARLVLDLLERLH